MVFSIEGRGRSVERAFRGRPEACAGSAGAPVFHPSAGYVIATGEQHSVREFVEASAQALGMNLTWRGSGLSEQAVDEKGRVVVAVDPRYMRPAEVDALLGDATQAREKLGWRPKTTFAHLVQEMVTEDLSAAEREALIRRKGYASFARAE